MGLPSVWVHRETAGLAVFAVPGLAVICRDWAGRGFAVMGSPWVCRAWVRRGFAVGIFMKPFNKMKRVLEMLYKNPSLGIGSCNCYLMIFMKPFIWE
uniref:Uncharacterized protein n=1 Tax=Fagus sylvatica TaxID=28930 RepID=A0A2N9IX01_FAGSY